MLWFLRKIVDAMFGTSPMVFVQLKAYRRRDELRPSATVQFSAIDGEEEKRRRKGEKKRSPSPSGEASVPSSLSSPAFSALPPLPSPPSSLADCPSLDSSFISTSSTTITMDSRESSPFDTSLASECESVATITQMDGMSMRSTPTISVATTTRRPRQPARPYRILAPEESVALLVAHSAQASAAAKEATCRRRTSTRALKKKGKKTDGELAPWISHISSPAPPSLPRGRQAEVLLPPRPPSLPLHWKCCPSCDSAVGKRLSAPGYTMGDDPSTRRDLSSSRASGDEYNADVPVCEDVSLSASMASSVVSSKHNKDEEGTRLSFLSSSTGYSSARSSLRSSGEDSPTEAPPLSHVHSGSLRASLLGRPSSLSQLDRICIELLDTERAFVVDLGDVIQGYLNFMITHREQLGVTVDDVSATFGCIERIYALNRVLYQQLDAAQLNAVKMCECFIANAARFDDYVTYCTNYQKMLSTLVSLSSRPSVASALRERQSSLGHALPLSAYLLKPVQRILKYHLFIENMLRELESSSADAASMGTVRRALEEMTAQAARMNDEKKKSEHVERVAQLQRILAQWRSDQSTDLSAYGELILEASFKLAGSKTTRQLFLFEEMLLIAKQRGNQLIARDYIMCSNLMLNESVSTDPLAFQVLSFDSPRAQYLFLASNTDQKRVWMRELKRAVLDHFDVVIPEETKRLMLSMDNTQVKVPFGRPEFAEVTLKAAKKIPKYLEKRRKSVDGRDRRRSLSTSRLATSTSQTSMPPAATIAHPKCTCRAEPMTSNRSLSSSTVDFNASVPSPSSSSSGSSTSPFSLFTRKKATDGGHERAPSGRSRFFVARKARQLPPTGRESQDDAPLSPPPVASPPATTAETIEKSFDEIYRNLQMFGADQCVPDRADATRRLDRLVSSRSSEERAEMRLRSKSLTRLDDSNGKPRLDAERIERYEHVGGWEPTERQQRIRMGRNAPLARFEHFDSPFEGSPSPAPFAASHPPYSARAGSALWEQRMSCARQRSPLSPEQCRMLDTTLIVPDLGIVREMISQIERA